MNSEIRKDYLTNKKVIIAPARSKRPHGVKKTGCPLCPGQLTEKIIDQIGKEKWQVVCLSNPFSAVSPKNKNAYGYQEVIVETPDHSKPLARASEAEILNVLKMFALRTKALSRDKKINYILCFKNSGQAAGASLGHSHSQIFATQILPPDISEEIKLAQEYKKKNRSCFYCDLLKKEKKTKRHIWSDKNMIAIAPIASQYSYEAWIFSQKHIDNITQLKDNELRSLAKILKKIISKLDKADISYNFFLQQAIACRDEHFILKIQPRNNIWAGLELGTGIAINPVAPEEAVKFYKK